MHRRPLVLDILLGAAAGAAATWTMDRLTTAVYERTSDDVKERENEARGDRTAYEAAAEKGAAFAGREISDEQRKAISSAIHWSLGVGAGAIYGLLRNRFRMFRIGSGLAYGAAFWIVMDEGIVAFLGLTPPPSAFPWQTHIRGLAGHLALGGAIESVFDVIDALT